MLTSLWLSFAFLYPFLKTGMISANFRLDGNVPGVHYR